MKYGINNVKIKTEKEIIEGMCMAAVARVFQARSVVGTRLVDYYICDILHTYRSSTCTDNVDDHSNHVLGSAGKIVEQINENWRTKLKNLQQRQTRIVSITL
uniref:Uncharacterized protein n=1 Tax=Glossina austeni TaxID=7395 RepID=A0A1A9VF10_GLOAU